MFLCNVSVISAKRILEHPAQRTISSSLVKIIQILGKITRFHVKLLYPYVTSLAIYTIQLHNLSDFQIHVLIWCNFSLTAQNMSMLVLLITDT